MYKEKKVFAVIGAAGVGKRMEVSMPKQFLKVSGRTILESTVEAINNCKFVDTIVLVVHGDYVDFCRKLMSPYSWRIEIVEGGKERQDSIYNGLKAIEKLGARADDIVMIHDGARPYVSSDLLDALCIETVGYKGVIPVIPPKDTIRHEGEGTLDRSKLFCVQTPQAFQFATIMAAHENALREGFYGTDDASLVDAMGETIHMIPGEESNIKITTKEDLPVSFRVGTGYDVHKLVEGRKLILGGIEIPYDKGLLGHSDADVLAHTLMDAILGAAGMGDIGKHFPDTDEKYKGADSIELFKEVMNLIKDEGYSFVNGDVTVICQRPKIAPYIEAMKNRLEEVIGVADCINIKGTTTEQLGFEGRGEGISCQAVCLLNK